MICVYPPDCVDFSSNGSGPLSPLSASVTETLNGEYELELAHPIDDAGKWSRLVEGAIIRAPVPAAMTPRINLAADVPGAETMIYRVSTSRDPLRLRSGPGLDHTILSKYAIGTEVVIIEKTNADWFEVSCPDGKRGYMSAQYLTHVRTETVPGTAIASIDTASMNPFALKLLLTTRYEMIMDRSAVIGDEMNDSTNESLNALSPLYFVNT